MATTDVYRMIRRRTRKLEEFPSGIGCHSCRATGITNFLLNGGSREKAQEIAAHRSSNTTGRYDRRPHLLSPTEIERIRYW